MYQADQSQRIAIQCSDSAHLRDVCFMTCILYLKHLKVITMRRDTMYRAITTHRDTIDSTHFRDFYVLRHVFYYHFYYLDCIHFHYLN